MEQPPNRTRRTAFMISGVIDVTNYGFANWHVNLLGAVMFILGTGTFAYNLSRLEEGHL